MSVSALDIVSSLALICLSALFSGLTLGVLGLDVSSLEILIASGDQEAVYARRILPIRRRGNLLLCTLVIGNVMVNTAISITMSSFTSGTVGFIVSTALIVIFGEITPQAVCSRYALWIGFRTAPLIYLLMFLMFPLAWPVSKVWDYALGKELPTIYNKKGLARLVEMHKEFDEEAQLRDEEANIMRGALEFADRRVSEIMTKIDKVFTLDIHQKLDFDTMKLIYTSGYSRIPCFDRSSRLNETCAGVLLVKDLILVDPEDGIQVTTILNIYGRDTLYVFPDIKLAELLVLFKTGRSHLAVVRDVEERLDGDPRYVIRGIVTLEDVIEVIMKDKIEDEADVYFDKFDPNVLNIFNDIFMGKFSDSHLTPDEAAAVYYHLNGTFPELNSLSKAAFGKLIESSQVYVIHRDVNKKKREDLLQLSKSHDVKDDIDISQGGFLLYKKGESSQYFTLILSGKIDVFSGNEAFKSQIGRFGSLGLKCILLDPMVYVPDFTAIVHSTSRVLRISRETYQQVLDEEAKRTSSQAEIPYVKETEVVQTMFSPNSFMELKELE